MKIKDIRDSIKNFSQVQKTTDLDGFFDIYTDRRGNLSFNLNETLFLKIDPSNFKTHICRSNQQWPLISYDVYGTTRLAWLLMKINDVTADDMFEPKHPGDAVYVIPTEILNTVLNYIKEG